MSTQQVRTSIDEVLQNAVDSGAVPNVAAIAADRDGIIYEGAAGPRAAGGSDPVSVDTHFRIMSMTKMVATVAALQLMERGRARPRRADRDLPARVGRDAGARGLRRRHAAAARAGHQGDGQAPDHAHVRARLLVLQRRHRALGGAHRHAERARGRERVFMAPLVADPGTRYEYGINTDWLGKVVEAASGMMLDAVIAEHITGPLGMDRDRVPDGRAPARELDAGPPQGRGRRLGGQRHRPAPGPGVLRRRPRPALHAARLPEVPAHAARRRHVARRRADPRQGHRRRRLHQPDRRHSTSRPRSRPPTPRPRATSTPARAGSGATACC